MFISEFLAFMLLCCLGICVYLWSKNSKRHNTKQAKMFAISAGLVLLCMIVVPGSIHTVESGEIAVVKVWGKASYVRVAGTYFDFWLSNSYDYYDAKVQQFDVVTPAFSQDAQTMSVSMSVQFKIQTSKGIDIANNYGSVASICDRIESVAFEKTKTVLSRRTAMDIITSRDKVSTETEAAIMEAVDNNDYCVTIVAVIITNIDFSDAFENVVEEKMIAEQEKLKAQYEKDKAIIDAEKELEVSKLNAQAKLALAEADAQAQIALAEAEAKAIKYKSIEVARALGFNIIENEITNESGEITAIDYTIDFEGKTNEEIALIVDYLKYIEYLSKWNGELPSVYVTDGNASIIIPTT